MATTLAFLHTGHVLVPVFAQLAKEYLPGVSTFHMLDESLIRDTVAAGELRRPTVRRLVTLIGLAHEAGADAVMVTCSSIGKGVAVARQQYDFPILRVDEPMAEAAVGMGERIGVAATLRSTLEPTIELLEETAATFGRRIHLVSRLCDGAFECLMQGNPERHDALLSEALAELRSQCDVIVLAQASMARVAAQFESQPGPPILSSPELAIKHARQLLPEMASSIR